MRSVSLVYVVTILISMGGVSAQSIDNSIPIPNENSPLREEVASPEVYAPDMPSGLTIKRALGIQYSDQALVNSRGRLGMEIYRNISPSVVIVLTDDSLGSGSLIESNKILTNWHVVKGAKTVGLLFKPQVEGAPPSENSLVMAKVIKFDPLLDLALLQISSPVNNLRPISLATEADIQIGADVHAIGHSSGKAWTYTAGIISQYRRDFEWKSEDGLHKANVVQTQTPINPGNSGGPLITDTGKLVGVNSFKATGEGLNFAVSIVDVQRFLPTSPPSQQQAIAPDSTCQTTKMFEGRERRNTGSFVQYDTNCDGKADVWVVTPDDVAKPTLALFDRNFDGKVDITVEDIDRNGKWDISFHDVDYNGTLDLIGFHPDGKITPSRFENYIAARCNKTDLVSYNPGRCP